MTGESMTLEELHILEHATGWDARRKKDRLHRNYFCAGPGHSDMPTLTNLCDRGLMKAVGMPCELSGGSQFYRVTDEGIALLKRWRP